MMQPHPSIFLAIVEQLQHFGNMGRSVCRSGWAAHEREQFGERAHQLVQNVGSYAV